MMTETQLQLLGQQSSLMSSLVGLQVIVNLVEQGGREKMIGDAYLKQVLLYNNPNLTYVSFDFHEHW